MLVEARRVGDRAVLYVEDRGIGIVRRPARRPQRAAGHAADGRRRRLPDDGPGRGRPPGGPARRQGRAAAGRRTRHGRRRAAADHGARAPRRCSAAPPCWPERTAAASGQPQSALARSRQPLALESSPSRGGSTRLRRWSVRRPVVAASAAIPPTVAATPVRLGRLAISGSGDSGFGDRGFGDSGRGGSGLGGASLGGFAAAAENFGDVDRFGNSKNEPAQLVRPHRRRRRGRSRPPQGRSRRPCRCRSGPPSDQWRQSAERLQQSRRRAGTARPSTAGARVPRQRPQQRPAGRSRVDRTTSPRPSWSTTRTRDRSMTTWPMSSTRTSTSVRRRPQHRRCGRRYSAQLPATEPGSGAPAGWCALAERWT